MLAAVNPTVFTAIGSCTSALVAIIALVVAWRVYTNHVWINRPVVVVYANLEESNSSQEIWSLVIENTGNETACDIGFNLPDPGVYRAFADGKESLINDGPLVVGIPVLPRGQRLKFWWGVGPAHYNRYFKSPFVITARYKVARPRLFRKSKTVQMTNSSQIRIDGFDYQRIVSRKNNQEGVKIQSVIPEIRGLHS